MREEDVDGVLAAVTSSADDELFQFINTFESEFDDLVREYVGADGYLVVFIDDLDRCLPENAIEVVEALKLYLDRASCVFVVGAQPDVIEEAVRRRYDDSPALAAVEYLEKVIQVPFVLPRIRTEMALRLVGAEGDVFVRDPEMGKLIRLGAGRNPRRVKRLFNVFALNSRIEGELAREEQLSLMKILIIQMRFPGFYRELSQRPGLIDRLAGADETRWNAEGMAPLFQDFALRRFLERTTAVSSDSKSVSRWIRLATTQRHEMDELDEPPEPMHPELLTQQTRTKPQSD